MTYPAPKPAAGSTTRVQITGSGGVPSGAAAVVLNVTATQSAAGGFVQVMPGGAPDAGKYSNLNLVRTGQTAAGLATVPLASDGTVSVYTSTSAHLIVDVAGYYTGASAEVAGNGLFVAIAPTRMTDTRSGAHPRLGSRRCRRTRRARRGPVHWGRGGRDEPDRDPDHRDRVPDRLPGRDRPPGHVERQHGTGQADHRQRGADEGRRRRRAQRVRLTVGARAGRRGRLLHRRRRRRRHRSCPGSRSRRRTPPSTTSANRGTTGSTPTATARTPGRRS